MTGALGAGKSRLLGALFGLAPCASGAIELNGAPWRPKDPAEAIAKRVFMAGEDRWRSSLLPPLTPGGDIAGTIAPPHRKSWFPWGVVGELFASAPALAKPTSGPRERWLAEPISAKMGASKAAAAIGMTTATAIFEEYREA